MASNLGRGYSIASNGKFVMLTTRPDIPSDLAVGNIKGGQPKVITTVNADLFANKELGKVEEIWYKSSHDGLDIHCLLYTSPSPRD